MYIPVSARLIVGPVQLVGPVMYNSTVHNMYLVPCTT